MSVCNSFQAESDLETGEPLDKLSSGAKQLLESLGSKSTKVSEVIETHDSAVYTAIQDGLERANRQAISNAQKVGEVVVVVVHALL